MDIYERISRIKSHVGFDCEVAKLAHNGLKLIRNGLKEAAVQDQIPLLIPLLDSIERCPAWKNCQDFWGAKDLVLGTLEDGYEFFTHRRLFDVPRAAAQPQRPHRLESALGKLIYIVQFVFNTILRAAGVLDLLSDCGAEYKEKFLQTLRTVGSYSSWTKNICPALADGFEYVAKNVQAAGIVGVLLDIWEQCRDMVQYCREVPRENEAPHYWWNAKAFVKVVQDVIKLIGIGAKAMKAENLECIAKVLNSIIKLCAS